MKYPDACLKVQKTIISLIRKITSKLLILNTASKESHCQVPAIVEKRKIKLINFLFLDGKSFRP